MPLSARVAQMFDWPGPTITRHELLRLALSSVSVGAAFGLPRASNAAQPTTDSAHLLIHEGAYNGAIASRFVGLSYEKNKLSRKFFTPYNSRLIGCFRTLGRGVLRVGGNTADKTAWNSNGPGGTSGEIGPPDVDLLAAFLKITEWQAIYGLNLPTNSPSGAASEAAYVSKALGSNLLSLEIGNEGDGYSKNGLRQTTYAISDFIAEWSQLASAVRQAVPNVPLSGPASGYRLEDWTVPFAAAEGAQLDFLSQHLYEGSGKSPDSTIARLLGNPAFVPRILTTLRDTASSNHIIGGYRLTESNSLYGGGAPGVSDAYGSALWAIEFLMINGRYDSKGVNFHGGGDGTYNPFYTPIADIHNVIVDVRPVYYGMLFVSRLLPGRMYDVSLTTALNLTAYAVDAQNGATNVVLLNKEPTTTAATSITLPKKASSASSLVLLGDGLDALTGTTLAKSRVDIDGTWSPRMDNIHLPQPGTNLEIEVPPASAIMLTVT